MPCDTHIKHIAARLCPWVFPDRMGSELLGSFFQGWGPAFLPPQLAILQGPGEPSPRREAGDTPVPRAHQGALRGLRQGFKKRQLLSTRQHLVPAPGSCPHLTWFCHHPVATEPEPQAWPQQRGTWRRLFPRRQRCQAKPLQPRSYPTQHRHLLP